MQRLFRNIGIIAVLSVTMPFLFGWIPGDILQPILTVFFGLGLVVAVIALPIWFLLFVLDGTRKR